MIYKSIDQQRDAVDLLNVKYISQSWTSSLKPSLYCKLSFALVKLIYGQTNPEHSQTQLFLVRLLMEYKSNSTGPCSLQHDVFQSFSVRAVMPLRKICTAIGPVRGRVNLNIVHTSAAFKSTRQNHKNSKASKCCLIIQFLGCKYK